MENLCKQQPSLTLRIAGSELHTRCCFSATAKTSSAFTQDTRALIASINAIDASSGSSGEKPGDDPELYPERRIIRAEFEGLQSTVQLTEDALDFVSTELVRSLDVMIDS